MESFLLQRLNISYNYVNLGGSFLSKTSPVVKKLNKLRRQGPNPHLLIPAKMRDEPEGNSIMQKSKLRLYAPVTPNKTSLSSHSMAAARKSKRHKLTADDINLDHMDDKFLMKKAKKVDISQTCTFNSLNFTTSTTVGQSDTLISQSNVSNAGGSRAKKIDMSWENAVETARGQPDGAERSFHETKLSRVDEDDDEGSIGAAKSVENDDEEEELPAAEEKKKKSIKTQIKTAARRLKSFRVKGGKSGGAEPGTPGKRKIVNPALTDDTCNPESPKKKLKFEEMTRKERKKMRRLMKNNSELIKSSKNVWEELRRHDLAEERRIELCDVLYKHVKGKVKEMVFAHDTARVIQCLIQFGDPDQRQMVFEEMKDQMVPMAKSKYAKFVVRKVLKYGTRPQKNFVFKAFHGNVRKLIRHKEAAEVVEYAYNEYANASQRLALLEEFYGPSFILFKTFETKCLDDIMLSQPDKKDMILSNMKEALLPLVDKSILMHSLVHRVFFEFFHYANSKMKTDMIEVLREGLVSMLHTRDGARVAMQCVWHGTTKDRKIIIKSLKSHVVKVCQEEYGHMLLLALFDVVDDTRILQKIIIDEMLKSVEQVATDQYGRKVLIYLLSPRDPLHFHPDIVRILQEGDKNTTSKKDMSTRHKELLEAVSEPLLQYVIDHTKDLVLNNASLLFLLSILTHAQGDPTQAMEAVAKIAAEPFTAGSLDNFHIVEHPAGHLTLKRLILNDKDRLQQGNTVLFSQVLMNTLPSGRLKSWAACNRGCFILLGLLELENPKVTAEVQKQLAGVKKSLKKMTFKGSHILLQKLGDTD